MHKQESNNIPFSFELVTYPHSIVNDLHDYRQFYTEVEKLFEKNDEKLQAHITEKLKEIPENNHDRFIESYTYDLHKNQFMFPSMHRGSMFITLYNFLEHHLNLLCSQIGDELKSNICIRDLKGSGIERALLFLKKIPEFKFDRINKELSFIKNTNRLRNCVVHNGSVLPENESDKINKFVKAQESLSGNPGDIVIFRSEFISAYIEILQAFFKEIENEIQRFLDKYRT
ncbi:MAG: hypothetical protein ACE5KZ_01195 [Candidatus Scalinduaceae bacterium]